MSKHIRLAIIGSGPAGYSAAIYSSRAQLNPIVFAGSEIGGQLMYTTEVENFPGHPEGIRGPKLMNDIKTQAEKFGAKVLFESVSKLDLSSKPFKIWVNDMQSDPHYFADSLIISTGATAMMLNLDNERELLGRGVSTCAVCDAAFFREKKVFVVGGGDSAMEDALALANFSDQVTIIHRRDKFRASKIMQTRVLNHKKISVLWNSHVKKINGTEKLESLEIETAGVVSNHQADGLFMAIGHRPQNSLISDQLELTAEGYIVTSQSPSKEGTVLATKRVNNQGKIVYPTMTSAEGVFAAGDVVDLRYRQAITASGMGAAAALDAEAWLLENQG